jgi:hypothetical protein
LQTTLLKDLEDWFTVWNFQIRRLRIVIIAKCETNDQICHVQKKLLVLNKDESCGSKNSVCKGSRWKSIARCSFN